MSNEVAVPAVVSTAEVKPTKTQFWYWRLAFNKIIEEIEAHVDGDERWAVIWLTDTGAYIFLIN